MAVNVGLNFNPRIGSALSRKQYNDGIRIAHQVAPTAIVPAETVDIMTSAEETDLVLETLRAAGAEAKQVTYGDGSTTSISLVERMLKVKFDQREMDEWTAKMAAFPGAQTSFVPPKLLKLRRDILDEEEYRTALLAFGAANYAADHKSAAGDFSATGILARMQTASDVIFDSVGRRPRLLTIGTSALADLVVNPDIRARYTAPAGQVPMIDETILANYFSSVGVEKVIVGRASRKIAGTATKFWTVDSALLSVSDFDASPDAFILDDQTFMATPTLPYADGQTSQDRSEFFGARQDGPTGVERLYEVAIGKIYKAMAMNWSAGFLFTAV